MSVQTFDDDVLRTSGRIHLSADVVRAHALFREFGFDWVNLDLMVGLPGETLEIWKDSVSKVIALSPESATVYQTEIPFNTKYYRDLKEGRLASPSVSWEVIRERLDYTFHELERAGYTLVSGYAAVKDRARHRFQYQNHLWRGGDMLGLGLASFSYMRGAHFQNATKMEEYENQVHSRRLPIHRAHCLTHPEQLVREFILQLKWGAIWATDFESKFGVNVLEFFAETLNTLADEGCLTVSKTGVQLTPAGLLRVDELLSYFYQPEYQGVRYS